jgi:hypothetical protein
MLDHQAAPDEGVEQFRQRVVAHAEPSAFGSFQPSYQSARPS